MAVVLTTLVSFNQNDGEGLIGPLILDSKGDLFGTAYGGGTNGDGTVFEIVKTTSGYASAPTILANFNDTDGGANPWGNLVADNKGNLFGVTFFSGEAIGDGTVFEVVKTKSGYANTPTTLFSFDGTNGHSPEGSLIADSKGNLFGTTVQGGTNGWGTVFEVVKTGSDYANAPNTLVNFNYADGAYPSGDLAFDAKGNLFGATTTGGTNGFGTVFEIVKTGSSYASTPTTLVEFSSADGAYPVGGLIADSKGNLFGTTLNGGMYNDGTVFEIVKTASGYASTPTTLVSFNGTNGADPEGSLIVDAKGNLFGTTPSGGANNEGTVFEIVKTASGYASTPTTLVTFDGTNGAYPRGGLIADANGDLFGTTNRTVFEIVGSGFDVGHVGHYVI